MAGRCDSEKHAEWRKRLGRFSRCGLTVARFCSGERVSVASFYYWRRKLQQGARRGRVPARPGVFRQVAVAAAPPAMVSATSAVVPAPPAMTPGIPAVVRATRAVAAATSAGVPAACTVSIQLPCGTRIEVGAKHRDAVRTVIGEVVCLDRSPEAKASASFLASDS